MLQSALELHFSRKSNIHLTITVDFEDEDFDLDSDLEPVTQRSYVSLNQETEETPAEEETSSEQDAEV